MLEIQANVDKSTQNEKLMSDQFVECLASLSFQKEQVGVFLHFANISGLSWEGLATTAIAQTELQINEVDTVNQLGATLVILFREAIDMTSSKEPLEGHEN